MAVLAPATPAELAEAVSQAAGAGAKLEIRGGGSKAGIGAPCADCDILEMRGFAGVADYDPAELVLSVGAGTSLDEVQALVAGEGQMLAFEPFDYGPILGAPAGAGTIGGVVAAGVAGPRRLTRGGVRDHLLGFTAVSGRGEAFVAGAKVVKNVTGYDLPKLMCGSWGRLAALTEVTLKVLPAPRETVTRVARGLNPAEAYAVMARALGSQAEVSAAAHLPDEEGEATSRTLLRLEGFGPSVKARSAMLDSLFADLETPDAATAAALWRDVTTLAPLSGSAPLWRISIPAKRFSGLVEVLRPRGARWIADAAGGLLWVRGGGDPAMVRDLAGSAGGHAILVQADPSLRAAVPALHPQPKGIAALEARIRRAFDPLGVFETGRFGEPPRAD